MTIMPAMTKTQYEELKALITEQRPCPDDVLNRIEQIQAVQTNQIEQMMETVKGLSLTIYGNGHPGLTTVVNALTQRLDDSNKSTGNWGSFWRDILKTVVIAAVMYFIALAMLHGKI
jgi:hypothetical protein